MAFSSFDFCGYKIVPFRHGAPMVATKVFRAFEHSHMLAVTAKDHVIAYSNRKLFRYAYPRLNSSHARLAEHLEKAGLGNDATALYLEEYHTDLAKRERARLASNFIKAAAEFGIKLTAEQKRRLK